MKIALAAAIVASLAATAAADPVKRDGHALDFTRPAKWETSESDSTPAFWRGNYTADKPARAVIVDVSSHKLEDGKLDLDKKLADVASMMAVYKLDPDGKPAHITANGFDGLQQRFAAKDGAKWGVIAVLDAGALTLTVRSYARPEATDLAKTITDLLGSVTVDGKKGPAVYPAKK